MSEEVRGNSSHGPAETGNPNKMMTTKKYEETRRMILPEWLEEFKDNQVDERVPEHRDAS